MIYRVFVFILLFLTPNFIKCDDTLQNSNDLIVLSAINLYRSDVLCDGVINMRFMSVNSKMVKRANSKLEIVLNDTIAVTAETCGLNVNRNLTLEKNLENFMETCIKKAKAGIEKLSWMWNPAFTDIGCIYPKPLTKHILFCLVKKPYQTDDLTKQGLIYDESKNYVDQLILNRTLKSQICQSSNHDPNYQLCYLFKNTRINLAKEFNSFRQKLAKDLSYGNIPLVHWNYELEIAAIKVSQFYRVPENFCMNFSTNFKNGIGLYDFTTDFAVGASVFPSLIKDSENNAFAEVSNHSDLIERPLFWMYDTDVTEFGCAYFQISVVKEREFRFLCAFNKKLNTKYTWNLVKGPLCTTCSCSNGMYPSLCTGIVTSHTTVYQKFIFSVSVYFMYILILVVILNIFNMVILLKAVINFREIMLEPHPERFFTYTK